MPASHTSLSSHPIHMIAIVGPTASGKSELAVRIAKKYSGEIISADSRQVYKGLNIGTAKVPGVWQRGVFVYKKIPHHCIDFVPPQKTYSVAEYQICAAAAIRDIAHRGKIPILVGGTGLWIDAVVYGWQLPHVAPDKKLRAHLEKKTAPELLKMLQKIDPARARTVEQKNPRRIIRAIEIAQALGSIPPLKKQSRYDALWIGLRPPQDKLARRISERAGNMLHQGLPRETKALLKQRISKKRIRELGFEYRAALEYVSGTITKKEYAEKIAHDTKKYARRQMTWWKRNQEIIWIVDPDSQKPLTLTRAFLTG